MLVAPHHTTSNGIQPGNSGMRLSNSGTHRDNDGMRLGSSGMMIRSLIGEENASRVHSLLLSICLCHMLDMGNQTER